MGNCLNAFIYPFCILVQSVAILSVQVDNEGMFDHALGGCRSTWNTPSWHCFPHSVKLDFCIVLASVEDFSPQHVLDFSPGEE